jgi:hypothetical protein
VKEEEKEEKEGDDEDENEDGEDDEDDESSDSDEEEEQDDNIETAADIQVEDVGKYRNARAEICLYITQLTLFSRIINQIPTTWILSPRKTR